MTDTRTEGSAVVDDQVASGSADLETDARARRQAGFRLWTQLLRRAAEKEARLGRGQVSQDREI